ARRTGPAAQDRRAAAPAERARARAGAARGSRRLGRRGFQVRGRDLARARRDRARCAGPDEDAGGDGVRARMFTDANRKWWTLVAVSFGLFMIMLDNTVVNVALPSIRADLGISISELEWVVNAYALTFGVLLLSGGKLADLLGRRRIFVAGLVIFTAASLWCGLADSAGSLIAARTVQGVGAALLNPATLSIITATFPPRQRGTAIGIWAGVSALSLAIGPMVGGVLTERIDWSWIFFVNIPVGVLAIV